MKSFSGKEKKVEDVLIENYDKYYRLAYSYVRNDADAGDIVQNGAYRAIRASHTLKNTEYAKTWVYRIMLNEIFRFCKSKHNSVTSLEELTYEKGKEDIYENIDLQRAIDTLEDKEKAIIELRFFEDMKLEEISEIMEENLSTVKSRMYRSMKKLKLKLEAE